MRTRLLRHRPGTSLIELLIFMAILAAIGMAVFPLLFSSTEDRLLQQTVALVEQNGLQIIQAVGSRVAQAEKILSPSQASTGSVLALQSGSGSINPIILGLSGGTLVVAERTTLQELSSSQVAVGNLEFQNTSVTSSRQSFELTFRVSRAIRLQAPHSYAQDFRATFTLPPDDVLAESDCACAVPGCAGTTYVWEVCDAGVCRESEASMTCP